MLQRHGPAPSVALLADLMREADADVRAAAVFAAGVQGAKAGGRRRRPALKDLSPLVQRRAAEALVRHGAVADGARASRRSPTSTRCSDRPIASSRFAGRLALQRTARARLARRVLADTHTVRGLEGDGRATSSPRPIAPTCCRSSIGQIALMGRSDLSVDLQLRLLRAFQLAAIEAARLTQPAPPANVRRDGQAGFQAQTITAGDIDAARLQQVHQKLIARFPSTDERLTRELASVLAFCGQPGAIGEDPRGDAQGRHQPGAADPPAHCAARRRPAAGRRRRRRS